MAPFLCDVDVINNEQRIHNVGGPWHRTRSGGNVNIANIVSYLCKFGTKLHQILDASLSNIHKVARLCTLKTEIDWSN